MRKILTISIAAYNVEKYIHETLFPFTQMKHKDEIEVLIIDDGSSDKTAELGEQYVHQYPSTFKVIKKQNGGWGSTVNVGIEQATGKYFRILDGDDYFNSQHMDEYIEWLDKNNADLVITPFVKFDNKTGAIFEENYFEFKSSIRTQNYSNIANSYDLTMASCAIRTQLLKQSKVKITEKCFYTDNEYMFLVGSLIKTYSYFNKAIYYYRYGTEGQSINISSRIKHYQDHEKVVLKILDLYLNYSGELIIKQSLRRKLIEVIVSQYVIYWSLPCSKENKKKIIEFDQYIKNMDAELYKMIDAKLVKVARTIKFNLYRIFHAYVCKGVRIK